MTHFLYGEQKEDAWQKYMPTAQEVRPVCQNATLDKDDAQ